MFSYKNPFAEFDSNVMSSEQIYEFFTEPYDSFTIPESKITEDKSPIIFIGGRGTGKTMLLRQFSYNVQKIVTGKTTYLEKIKNTKYIGVYFRVDKPLLQSLATLGKQSTIVNFEETIFTHYFELTIFKEYLEIIKILENDCKINVDDKKYIEILSELRGLLSLSTDFNFKTIDDLLQFIIEEINYIWDFQSKKAIDIDDSVQFEPRCNLILQGRLSDEFCRTKIFSILGIEETSILLLIDEFESFSEKQQTVINAAMRYNKDYGARLRIGMRPYGFKTFATVNSEDFVKEGRDYSKIEFDNPLIKKGNTNNYFELIKKITEKRLDSVPMFAGKSIVDFLGEEEDFEAEAKEIVKGKTKHIEIYLKEINKNFNCELTTDSIAFIRSDNPLYEMECLRLLLKGESLEYVKKAFEDYKNKINSDEAKKFSNDYDNKYKLSFIFVLCSIYKKEKKGYYSFKDYCYLSSGIIGSFIELCRRAFDMAYFKDNLGLEQGKISKEIQTDAAYEYSYAERSMIRRIAEYGNKLEIFIKNLGDTFSCIHRDIYIRYPETNLFPSPNSISEENRKLLEVACMWSLVIKKPNAQDGSGKSNIQDMFMLSRVFSPVFKISYRTRGGFNPIKELTDDYFSNNFNPETVLKDKTKNHPKNQNVKGQISLFES